MKIEIDDEMLAVAENFQKEMTTPVTAESEKIFCALRVELIARLLSKIDTEKMYQKAVA